MERLRLHPRSQEFQWTSPSPPFRRITPAEARSFDELGYVVVEHAFSHQAITDMVAEIDPLEEELEAVVRQQDGGRIGIARAGEITFTAHLVARSHHLREVVRSAPLVDLCADLLGPDVRLYWDQAVYKKPGTGASFPWHQDNGYAFVEPQQYLTCWIALTDATEENGCPWVVPGLHRRGTFRHWPSETGLVCMDQADGAVPAPVGAGGIVVFSSLTPHSTGPNRTDATRKSYIVQYAPDGACVLAGDEGAATLRVPATAPDRQFLVLVGGKTAGEGTTNGDTGGSERAS